MAEQEQVKSKRDQFGERLRNKYPDREYADDEALFGQISDDYDQYDKDLADRDNQIGEYRKREDQLANMMDSDPRAASMLVSMRDGEDPTLGLVRRFGTEIRDFLDDPDKQEDIAKAQAQYIERLTKSRELDELYEKNLKESVSVMEAYQQECNLSSEDMDNLMQNIIAVGNDMVVGKFTRETLEMFGKAMKFDSAVAEAESQGEIRGRNTRIEEKLRKPSQGDGLPQLESQSGASTKPQSDYGAIDNMAGNTSIWERGNMRRVKR